MKKNHLFTCSVIVVLVIISGIKIFSTPVKTVNITSTESSKIISKYLIQSVDTLYNYSFANELLPLDNARVNKKMQSSIARHSFRSVQSNVLQNKAERIFPIIEPILKAYGIPDDFKYVPLVEAGFSEGTSIKGAKGLWQFMPGTARTYGLKVGHGIDERTNIKKSTVAACKYIKSLYNQFNSWTLAAAAYNNGEIKLLKAINKQKEDNYFSMHLNTETGNYVYNLIAMKAIISQPYRYGYKNYIKMAPANLLAYN